MTEAERKMLKEVHVMLKWLIIDRKIEKCGHDPKERIEAVALSAQLPRLPRSCINYDKIGNAIFSDRRRGTLREDAAQRSKDALFSKRKGDEE